VKDEIKAAQIKSCSAIYRYFAVSLASHRSPLMERLADLESLADVLIVY
jgi:hypothetical protein